MAALQDINTITTVLAILGVVLGLFGLIASTFSIIARARAKGRKVYGTVTVRAYLPQSTSNELRIQVAVKDPMGDTVAKGITSGDYIYETTLTPGLYKVFVNAPGHCEYMEIIKVAAEQVCAVRAYLNAVSVPALNMSR